MKLPSISYYDNELPVGTSMTCIFSEREFYSVGNEYVVIERKHYNSSELQFTPISSDMVNQFDDSHMSIYWTDHELKYGSFGVLLYPTSKLTGKQRFYFKFGGKFDGFEDG